MASDLQKKLDYILDEKINKIIPYNIRKGVDIFGVSGECVGVDSTDATATPGDIMYGKTAYVNDQKITGTIPDNDYLYYTPSTQNQSIPAGYTDGGTVWGDKNLIASNIKKDVEIFNIKGTYDSGVITADATASADEILSGETAYVNGEKITGTMPKLGNQTITPSTQDQRIGQGYLTSALIYGDSNLVADNIREGVEIFGVEGNFKPGIDTSDATATANDIMLNKIAYTYDGRVVGKHECLDTSDATASTDRKSVV